MKNEWYEARESIMTDLIEEFFNKYQRYPNATEEYVMEQSIGEDQMRDAVYSQESIEDEFDDGYDY